jgi:hypothetical protein
MAHCSSIRYIYIWDDHGKELEASCEESANYPIKSFNLPPTSKIEIEVSREMARNHAKWHTVRV